MQKKQDIILLSARLIKTLVRFNILKISIYIYKIEILTYIIAFI